MSVVCLLADEQSAKNRSMEGRKQIKQMVFRFQTPMDSFILYTSQYKSIQSLSKADKGELLEALYAYASTDGDCSPSFTHPQTEMAYNFISSRIEENHDKYQKICEKRRVAGRKGGRPRKHQENGCSTANEKAKKGNGFSENQKKLTDTDTESRSISINPDTSSDTLKKVEDESSTLEKKEKKEKKKDFFNFQNNEVKKAESWEKWYRGVLALFNEAVSVYDSAIRPVRVLSPGRREALRALWSKYGYRAEDFKKAFHNMAVSKYCNGRTTDRRRPVDFDWLIRENNFTRAYEGSL